ncbi:glutamate ABC transporter substrate-binding protein [Haloechinothrix salitolerans]|uniref:Glutamate ABC transporter substrate-binding protein n=1 Tax=Haloechinothrix salitolerans TaxID=926830 RepID=A0ABW2C5U6_9PSEU
MTAWRAWLVSRITALVLTCVAVAVAGCGSDVAPNSLVAKAEDAGSLAIGTRFDQPGMSEQTLDGRFVGFDVDLARFVANELGVDDEDIEWVDVTADERESALMNGDVDMIVGTYSITEERKQEVAFAGPYFVTGQAILVRIGTKGINGPGALNGKTLCSVSGSTSAQRVKQRHAKNVELKEYPRYADCVTALLAGQVDAVTTDEAILAGYVAQNPELLKVVGQQFSEERYGIGLRKDDHSGQRAVNDAIRMFIGSGEWERSLRLHLGASGYKLPAPPAVTEG